MFSQIIRSKTMLFAMLLVVLSAIQGSMGVFSPYMSQEAFGWAGMVISIIVAALRIVTTMPLENK